MLSKAKRFIAVIGGGQCSKAEARVAEAVGRELARHGAILVCGGLGGVMEAACRGADAEGASALCGLLGLAVGFLWLNRYNRNIAGDERFMATILRVTPPTGVHHVSFP